MIEITVNGVGWRVAEETNVANLLSRNKLSAHFCVVEINHQIVSKNEFSSTQLNNGDKIEIVRFMAGG